MASAAWSHSLRKFRRSLRMNYETGVSVPFAWVLTRTNHNLIMVVFSVSSVWWNGVVSSCNAPPAGNHLQIFFTRAQDQASKKKFTHPIIFPFLLHVIRITWLVSWCLVMSIGFLSWTWARKSFIKILESCSSTEDKRSTKSERSFWGLGLECRNSRNNPSLKQ